MSCLTPKKAITHCLTRHELGEQKTQKRNPKEHPAMLKKKQEITDWLEIHRAQITSGKLVVFLQHEYHLLSGD